MASKDTVPSRPNPGSSKLFGTWTNMLNDIFNRAKSCKHRKHCIIYNVYTRASLLFCGYMRSQAGKNTVGPMLKVQHVRKNSQHTYTVTVSAKDSNVLLLLHVPRWWEVLPNSA